MKKYAVQFCLIFGILIFANFQTAFAVGLGGFVELSSGEGEMIDFDDTEEFDIDKKGGGFVFDTGVTENFFNYRLQIGYHFIESEGDTEGNQVSVDNNFGFAFLRNDVVRLWVGPQIHLSYTDWDFDAHSTYFGIGFGGVFGANFHVSDSLSICPQIGFRYQINIDTDSDDWDEDDDDYYDDDYDYSYSETLVFFNVSFLFKLGE